MRATAPARYLPFVPAPASSTASSARGSHTGEFRWRLGLRPLDPRDWIELGPTGDAAIAATAEIADAHPDVVLAWLDDVEAEAAEVAHALVTHLRSRWPARFADAALDPDRHPLDAAGRLVPEDLVLLVRRGGQLVVGGGSVCFPNRWDLRSKLGRTLAETHAPVPRLNEQLGRQLDRFLTRLTPERGFWRLGWGIIDTPDWFAPPRSGSGARPGTRPGELHLRVERETIRRFPRTGAVLFTIRTHLTPLPEVADDAATASALADRLEQMPADVRGYKGLAAVADGLVTDLRRWRSAES